jgi:hypothetical protein
MSFRVDPKVCNHSFFSVSYVHGEGYRCNACGTPMRPVVTEGVFVRNMTPENHDHTGEECGFCRRRTRALTNIPANRIEIFRCRDCSAVWRKFGPTPGSPEGSFSVISLNFKQCCDNQLGDLDYIWTYVDTRVVEELEASLKLLQDRVADRDKQIETLVRPYGHGENLHQFEITAPNGQKIGRYDAGEITLYKETADCRCAPDDNDGHRDCPVHAWRRPVKQETMEEHLKRMGSPTHSICSECPPVRTCNRHPDCDAAEAKAKAKGMPERYGPGSIRVDHCHDEGCEDCFGC